MRKRLEAVTCNRHRRLQAADVCSVTTSEFPGDVETLAFRETAFLARAAEAVRDPGVVPERMLGM